MLRSASTPLAHLIRPQNAFIECNTAPGCTARRLCARMRPHALGSAPPHPQGLSACVPGLDSPRWVPQAMWSATPGLLTLAESARVAGGTVAVAGADVEMSAVPAVHATWVPGDLWSDKEGPLKGASSRQVPPGCWAQASGTAPQDTATSSNHPSSSPIPAPTGGSRYRDTYHRAPLHGPRL